MASHCCILSFRKTVLLAGTKLAVLQPGSCSLDLPYTDDTSLDGAIQTIFQKSDHQPQLQRSFASPLGVEAVSTTTARTSQPAPTKLYFRL